VLAMEQLARASQLYCSKNSSNDSIHSWVLPKRAIVFLLAGMLLNANFKTTESYLHVLKIPCIDFELPNSEIHSIFVESEPQQNEDRRKPSRITFLEGS